MSKCIVVVGGGFAGLWSALGAARLRHEQGLGVEALRIVLIERNDYHGIRVRNYEAQLDDCVVALDEVLLPVGIEQGGVLADTAHGAGPHDSSPPLSRPTRKRARRIEIIATITHPIAAAKPNWP